MSDNWVTLHSENGDEIVIQTFSIMGLVPYHFLDRGHVGCVVACDGGQQYLVREHISEVKALIGVEDDPEPQCKLVDDRAQLLQQISRQADTIFSQGKTIEYWQKKHDTAAKHAEELWSEVYRVQVRENKLNGDVSDLVKKLTETTEALTKVTQERDLLRANSRSHYFKITQEFDPKNSGLCDYAKWPG